MVHFPPLPSLAYEFSERYFGMSQSGFPHSEIPGSKTACVSPRLIAACHVLHRLLAPRHSPYALSSLTKCSLHLTYDRPLRAGQNTACVVVKKLPIAEYSVVKKSTYLSFDAATFVTASARTCLPFDSRLRARSGHSTRSLWLAMSEAAEPPSRMVENTGIEPVTSWLQTRRSPS
jgi:hypothetical protein